MFGTIEQGAQTAGNGASSRNFSLAEGRNNQHAGIMCVCVGMIFAQTNSEDSQQ